VFNDVTVTGYDCTKLQLKLHICELEPHILCRTARWEKPSTTV